MIQTSNKAVDTEWREGAVAEVKLTLTSTDTDGKPKVAGVLRIHNSGDKPLVMQGPGGRYVLAFFVTDELGNPISPRLSDGVKNIPVTRTLTISPNGSYTYHFTAFRIEHNESTFETFGFDTADQGLCFDLKRNNLYRVIAVFRPAGPHGPGFTSQEVKLRVP